MIKMLRALLAVLICFHATLNAATFFVATNGSDSNSGAELSPFYSISKATGLATAGDTIFVRGGAFNYINTIRITNSGTAIAPIKLWAYTNELPFLDFSAQSYASSNRAFYITGNGNYWHIKGLEIYRAGDNGIKIEGNNNIIEQCTFHDCRDSGLQIGLGDGDANNGSLAASNQVINCDSYLNYDPPDGGDADGFACKLSPGRGNIFRGCRCWENSDDGWDLFKSEYQIILEDCWTWHNGDPASFGASDAGNAGGFKLRGDSNFSGPHIVKRCIAFNNHFGGSGAGKAFHQNDNQAGITLYNCLSFSNNYNYALNNDISQQHIIKNCVGFNPVGPDHKNAATNNNTISISNSWSFPAITNNLQTNYVTLTEAAAKGARQADGSLPNNGFARLVAGSVLIDKGVDVGLPFNGPKPDLGPIEFTVAQLTITLSNALWTDGNFSFSVNGLTSHGPVVFHASTDVSNWSPIFTNPPVTGSLSFTNSSAGNDPQRFYRAEEK